MHSELSQNLRSIRRKSLLGQVILTLLTLELIFLISFVSFPLPTTTGTNIKQFIQTSFYTFSDYLPDTWQNWLNEEFPAVQKSTNQVRYSLYVPIIPTVILVAYVLEAPLGLFVTVSYLFLGIIGPLFGIFPFTTGGGLTYWQEPGFGYLLGLIPASWFVTKISSGLRTSKKQLLACLGGVLICHGLGLIYILGSSLFILMFQGQAAYLRFQPWLGEQLRNLSWYSLPYDLLFSCFLVALSFCVRWLTNILMIKSK